MLSLGLTHILVIVLYCNILVLELTQVLNQIRPQLRHAVLRELVQHDQPQIQATEQTGKIAVVDDVSVRAQKLLEVPLVVLAVRWIAVDEPRRGDAGVRSGSTYPRD